MQEEFDPLTTPDAVPSDPEESHNLDMNERVNQLESQMEEILQTLRRIQGPKLQFGDASAPFKGNPDTQDGTQFYGDASAPFQGIPDTGMGTEG